LNSLTSAQPDFEADGTVLASTHASMLNPVPDSRLAEGRKDIRLARPSKLADVVDPRTSGREDTPTFAKDPAFPRPLESTTDCPRASPNRQKATGESASTAFA
jgi:hypothetical protein